MYSIGVSFFCPEGKYYKIAIICYKGNENHKFKRFRFGNGLGNNNKFAEYLV